MLVADERKKDDVEIAVKDVHLLCQPVRYIEVISDLVLHLLFVERNLALFFELAQIALVLSFLPKDVLFELERLVVDLELLQRKRAALLVFAQGTNLRVEGHAGRALFE